MSMTNDDFIAIQTSIKRALSNVGNRNGHACPAGGSNTDPLFHNLLVAATGKSFFEAMHKSTLKEVDERFGEDIEAAKVGTETIVGVGSVYVLTLNKSKPAKRVDNKKLATELRRRGVDQGVIDEAIKAATVENAPSKRLSVTARV